MNARARLPLYAGLALATRLPSLWMSFYNGDEATYSALAVRLLHGARPWAGAVDHKPPGAEIIYAAIFSLAGDYRLWAVRAALIALVALTGALVARVADAIGEPEEVARRAGLLYVVASAIGLPSDVYAANTELFANLPVALAALCVARRRPVGLVAAGLLVAAAGAIRYQAAFLGAGFATALALTDDPLPLRARRLVLLALGFTAGAAAFLAVLRSLGIWEPFLFWGWRFNFTYMASAGGGEAVSSGATATGLVVGCWLPLIAAVTRARPRALPAAWLVAAAIALLPGLRFFPHYFLALLPPLALLAARGAPLLGRARRPLATLLVALVAIAAAGAAGYERLYPAHAKNLSTYRAVGEWLRAHAAAGDRLFVWGNSPEIYSYARLPMGTRFVFCNYHTGKIWGTRWNDGDDTGAEAHQVPRAWDELFADLDATPPRFVVDAAAGGLDRFGDHPIERYGRLAERITAGWERVAVVRGVPIYARRN